jgi:putative ABC transport system permease protein
MLAKLRSLVRNLRARGAFEDAMDDEMRFHLERRAADLASRGLPPVEAARRARLEFGSIEKQKDEARAGAGLRLIDESYGDLRYAVRIFAANKAFALTAVVTLALGIGANTAIFSLIDALMLQSLPVYRPQDLVQLNLAEPDKPAEPLFPSLTYPMVKAFDEQRDLFDGACGYGGEFSFAAGAPGAISRVPGTFVTGAFYETLGLHPSAGRLIARDDDKPGAPAVVVLSYGYWERQFVRSPQAIGQTLLLNGVPVTIIGVSPPGFAGANVGQTADVTLPAAALPAVTPQMAGLLGKGNFWLRTLARPKAGLSTAEAAVRLNTVWRQSADTLIAPHWSVAQRKEMASARFAFTPGATGWSYLREIYTKPLWILMAAVGLVLLIACANVASLLLARASARQREIAVRLAIGARRGRILRQLLVESAVLSLIGAACGLMLALFSGRVLLDILSTGPYRVDFDLTPNGHVLAFTTAAAMLTAMLFGLAPALQSTALNPAASLREDTRTATGISRWLPSLVTLQVALSLVLLIGAGLFLGTLRNLRNLDPGFRPEGVLLVDLDTPPSAPSALLDDIRRAPGVAAASISTHTPMSGSRWSEPAVPAGQPLPERATAVVVGASAQFFDTLRIPLVAGRAFTDGDGVGNQPVAIVNERYVQRFFAGKSPLGQHLRSKLNGEPRDLLIVGVARDTTVTGLRAAPPALVYIPYDQVPKNRFATVTVRASRAADVAAAMRRILQPALPTSPLEVRSLSTQVQTTMLQERLMATLAGALGLLALVLASVGIYGLLAYSVARRTREIGVRMALGAQPRGVIALMLRGVYGPLAIGILAGAPAAWLVARSIETMLFGLTPLDPIAIGGATLMLAAIALAAAYLPARRAARVDPLLALRSE